MPKNPRNSSGAFRDPDKNVVDCLRIRLGIHLKIQTGPSSSYITRQDCHSGTIFGWKVIEGSFAVKLPTIWRDGKAEVRRVREEKIRDGEDQRGRKSEERSWRCAKR